jgi:hypothetical protein
VVQDGFQHAIGPARYGRHVGPLFILAAPPKVSQAPRVFKGVFHKGQMVKAGLTENAMCLILNGIPKCPHVDSGIGHPRHRKIRLQAAQISAILDP